jgi:bacterioferritin
MGTKGREIVGKHAKQVVGLLNRAFADEWLAYDQYWIGAKLVSGPMKNAVNTELMQHAADELRHADMISNRIIQLGGTPASTPKTWFDLANCAYEEPSDPFVRRILEQDIAGEQCAIGVYNALLKAVTGKDPVTANIVTQILQDEVEHEEDLQALHEDLRTMLRERG